jgi:DNA-binding transcriptional ArsR family regulator
MTSSGKATELPVEFLQRMADALRTLAHPHRLKIVETLERGGPAPAHALTEALGLAQATASHHLNTMRRAGLIAAERRGREVWYRIADPDACTILDCMRKKRERPA